MVKVTLRDGTVVEGTSEEIYALDLFLETDMVESEEVTDVFTSNKRKVNEYRKGDIVNDGTKSAHFTVISEYALETGKVIFYTHDKVITIPIEEVKPIVFVESRLDRK